MRSRVAAMGSCTASVAAGKVPAPVRVRLKRVNCNEAIPYPPDGQAREWWQRLKNAFGTTSSAFVEASLYQLIAAARLPNSGICGNLCECQLGVHRGRQAPEMIECALGAKGVSRSTGAGSPDQARFGFLLTL